MPRNPKQRLDNEMQKSKLPRRQSVPPETQPNCLNPRLKKLAAKSLMLASEWAKPRHSGLLLPVCQLLRSNFPLPLLARQCGEGGLGGAAGAVEHTEVVKAVVAPTALPCPPACSLLVFLVSSSWPSRWPGLLFWRAPLPESRPSASKAPCLDRFKPRLVLASLQVCSSTSYEAFVAWPRSKTKTSLPTYLACRFNTRPHLVAAANSSI